LCNYDEEEADISSFDFQLEIVSMQLLISRESIKLEWYSKLCQMQHKKLH
jgi:hypothetical protein